MSGDRSAGLPRCCLGRPLERSPRPAILSVGREGIETSSFDELAREVERVAGGLAARGLERGEHVALLAPPAPHWIAACLGIARAGGVVVPIDGQLSRGALEHVLADCDARRVFTTRRRAERLDELDRRGDLEPLLLDAEDGDERGWLGLRGDPPDAEGDAGRVVVTFYTSGTTGPPKGVPLTAANLDAQVRAIAELGLLRADDRVLLPLPLHHVYPLVLGVLAPLSLGAAIVLPLRASGPQVLRALSEGEASVVVGVPRLYAGLLSGIDARARARGRVSAAALRGLESLAGLVRRASGVPAGRTLMAPVHRALGPRLRMVACGGAALDPRVGRRLEALGWDVAIGYGLTETSPLLALRRPGEGPLDTVGRPIPGVELHIDAGEGEAGEILARGPGVFAGYHGLPERTAEAFTDDGYFRTGDLGRLDDDGFLHVEGRADTRVTTVGGENVQPEEVEAAYEEDPALEEVGVLAEEGRLVALIVPAGEDADVRAAVERRSRGLPSYQRLADYVTAHEPLPRTRLGKIRRHDLRERWERARAGAGEVPEEPGLPDEQLVALLDDDAAAAAWELLRERFPDRRLAADTDVRLDLGIDSLDWLEWTATLRERAGVELDEEVVGAIETVRDLLEACADAPRAEEGAAPDEPSLDQETRRWLEPPGALGRALLVLGFPGLRLAMRALFHLRVEGVARLPDARGAGPLLLVPNHASYLDPFVLAAALGRERLSRTRWGGWVGVAFTNPITRAASRAFGVLPVDPRRAVRSSLALGEAVLERGDWLVWFAEGRRSETGELQPFRPGVGRLVARRRATAVPVRIEGTHEALPRGRRLPRRRPVRVVFGEPVPGEDLRSLAGGDERRIADALRERVASLGGHP